MNRATLLRYLLVVWIITIGASIFICANFLIHAYQYYNEVIKHNTASHYTINNHTYNDTFTNDAFQKALGSDAQKLSQEKLTQLRIEEQRQIIELAKQDISRKINQDALLLLIIIFISTALQRWYRSLKNNPQ